MVKRKKKKKITDLEKWSLNITNWVGTPISIIIHTLFFIGIFSLYIIGFDTDSILLILTTAVSLEAIYLAIFIQMTVNRNTASLQAVEEDIDELQEDVEEITEDVEDLTEDIEEFHEEDPTEDKDTIKAIENISKQLTKITKDLEILKTKGVKGKS